MVGLHNAYPLGLALSTAVDAHGVDIAVPAHHARRMFGQSLAHFGLHLAHGDAEGLGDLLRPLREFRFDLNSLLHLRERRDMLTDRFRFWFSRHDLFCCTNER